MLFLYVFHQQVFYSFFIGQFDKKGVIGIFIFVCNSPGLSMVPSSILIVFGWGKFKYSRMEFWLLTYKKTAFLLVLVHVHGCKSFAQSEIVSFLVLYFFWFDKIFQALQVIGNVVISSSNSLDDVLYRRILFNLVRKQIKWIVALNLHNSCKSKNCVVFKYLKRIFVLEDKCLLLITCTSNLLQIISKDFHDAIVSFYHSCYCLVVTMKSSYSYCCSSIG